MRNHFENEILFIEDNIADASYYSYMLKEIKPNINITHVLDIPEFEKISASKQFSMILLDINLSGSSGLDTINLVREIEQKSPIVVLTGQADRRLASLALKNGANDYLVKSIDDEKISKSMIEFWLEFSNKVYA